MIFLAFLATLDEKTVLDQLTSCKNNVYKCLVLNPFIFFLFRAIFSVLDLMKVDMANFAVSSIRPHLMQQSVEYERKKFQELLEKQPSTVNV